MKKLLLMVILSLISIESHTQTIGYDKVLHFSCSYIIQHNTYRFLEPRVGKKKAKLYSTVITLSVGAGKELIDQKYRGGWEVQDMYANGLAVTIFRYEIGN